MKNMTSLWSKCDSFCSEKPQLGAINIKAQISIISFVDDTLSSVIGTDNSISKQHAHDLELFLRFSTILERHLGDNGCVLGRVKCAFISYAEGAFSNSEEAGRNI